MALSPVSIIEGPTFSHCWKAVTPLWMTEKNNNVELITAHERVSMNLV